MSRLGTAFDLLDKAESLLGYDSQSSGKGFERLLNRSIMLPLLSRSWTRLPIQLQKRFDEHGKRLFDLVYEEVRAHAFHHRRTPKAIKLRTSTGKLRALPLDHYVPQLARAVRNSSHGLLQQLSGHDLDLVATHRCCSASRLGRPLRTNRLCAAWRCRACHRWSVVDRLGRESPLLSNVLQQPIDCIATASVERIGQRPCKITNVIDGRPAHLDEMATDLGRIEQ